MRIVDKYAGDLMRIVDKSMICLSIIVDCVVLFLMFWFVPTVSHSILEVIFSEWVLSIILSQYSLIAYNVYKFECRIYEFIILKEIQKFGRWSYIEALDYRILDFRTKYIDIKRIDDDTSTLVIHNHGADGGYGIKNHRCSYCYRKIPANVLFTFNIVEWINNGTRLDS